MLLDSYISKYQFHISLYIFHYSIRVCKLDNAMLRSGNDIDRLVITCIFLIANTYNGVIISSRPSTPQNVNNCYHIFLFAFHNVTQYVSQQCNSFLWHQAYAHVFLIFIILMGLTYIHEFVQTYLFNIRSNYINMTIFK